MGNLQSAPFRVASQISTSASRSAARTGVPKIVGRSPSAAVVAVLPVLVPSRGPAPTVDRALQRLYCDWRAEGPASGAPNEAAASSRGGALAGADRNVSDRRLGGSASGGAAACCLVC